MNTPEVFVDPAYFIGGTPTTPGFYETYELSDTDKLCFKCTLSDCKENSSKCLIKMSKKALS